MRPVFADLEWTEHEQGTLVAPANSIWWIYWREAKPILKDLGFGCFDAGSWFVEFTPGRPDADVEAGLEALQEALSVQVAAERAAIAQRLVRQAAYDEELRQRNEAFERQKAEEIAAGRARGKACWDEWGMFVEGKPKLLALLEKTELTRADVKAIDKIVRATERKGQLKLIEIERAPVTGGVDWPDETVEGALRYLTSMDDDWAQIKNGAGWSASSTSLGHWCTAMLDRDASSRALGIKAGRQLLRGYTAQLHDWLYHQGWDKTLFGTKAEAAEFARIEARMAGIREEHDEWLAFIAERTGANA